MSRYIDTVWSGLAIALFGEIIGLIFIFFVYDNWQFAVSLNSFIEDVFFGGPDRQAALISLAMVFNLALFFYLLNKSYFKAAKGVIMFGLVLAPYIVYLKFFAG